MLCCLAAIAWLSAFQDARPESSRRGDDPTDVRQMFVPTEHIEKFRDPETTYQTMRYDAFLDLLRAADAALRSRRFVGPAAGSISGRVDPDGRRVVGTSTWSFPKGHNGSVELWPWNLRVLAIRERGRSQRPDWGLASEGALMVRGLTPEARQVDVDWELPGESLERRWTIRGQTPKCASSRLQIDFPSGWQAWAPNSSQTEGPSADTRRIETKSSGESTWQIEFVPPDALDVEKPLLSWRGESSFRFGPVRTDVELRAVLQIDRERVPNIRIRLPASLSGLSLSTIGAAANWRKTVLPEGGVDWVAEFRRPPLGAVQLVAAGSLPTPTGRAWPLEKLTVPGALFRGERVDVVVDPALRLLELDGAGLSRKNLRIEGGSAHWQFVGFAKDRRPTIQLDVPRSEVEAQFQHFLDVGRERVRLAVNVDWTCVRGELVTPTLLAPAGWTLQRASVEPADRARAAATVEASSDGATHVAFPLTRPLGTGEKLRAVVQWERAAAGWTPASGAIVPLPEVAAPEAAIVGPTTYSVRLDPALPLRLAGDDSQWSAPASVAGAPPPNWNWDGDVTRFRYPPPLSHASLRGIESRRLAFDAEITHRIEPRREAWDLQTTFSFIVRSGDAGWIEIEASQPVPADARWTWSGGEDASADIQSFSAAPDAKSTRYRLPLRAGPSGRMALQTSWRTAAPTVEPIGFRIPDADGVAIRAVVVSSEADRLEVLAKGWVESPAAEVDPHNVRWSGRLDRADAAPSLSIRRAEAVAAAGEAGVVEGIVTVGGPRSRRIFHASLQTQSESPAAFELGAPAGAKLWSATFDGRATSAWVHQEGDQRGAISFAEPVPAGRRQIDVVFDAPVASENQSATPVVLAPWRAGRILWKIGTGNVSWDGQVDPRLLGALCWHSPEDERPTRDQQAERIAQGRGSAAGFAAQRAARLLHAAPEAIGLDQAEDLADALVLLERRLPDGWIVILEPSAVDDARIGRDSRAPPRSIDEWLAIVGLHATLGDGVLLLTARPLAAALDRDGARLAPSVFAEAKAAAIRNTGVDPWGAFVSAAQWRATFDLSRQMRSATIAAADETMTLYVLGDGRSLDALPTATPGRTLASALGFVAGSTAALAALYFAGPAAAVAVAAVAYLAGGAVNVALGFLLTGFAWGALAAAAAGMALRQGRRWRATATTALALFLVASPSVSAGDEQTALVPFDPARLDAPLASVEVPETLLRRLRSLAEGNKSPVVISSADYQGTLAGDRIDWSATLRLTAPNQEGPIKAPIGFIGVDVQSVEADGKPLGFLPPAATLPLVVTLPATPKSLLTIRFRTPIVDAENGSLVEFPLPAAAQQSFLIRGFSKRIELAPTPEARGFSVRHDAEGLRIVGTRGPIPLLQLLWRERLDATPLPSLTAAVAFKPEGKSGAWECQTHFRWSREPGAHQIVIPIPPGVTIRRLEGSGLVGWKTGADLAGVQQLKATIGPGTGPGTLTIHSWFVPTDLQSLSPPLLFPESPSVRGVAAVVLPEDGNFDVAAGRGVTELDPVAFRDEWRRAANYDPPEGTSKAFAFTSQDHALAVQLKPAGEPWRMSQEHALRVAPHGRAAAWSASFRFAATDPIESATLAVPPGFHVQRVESDALFQWFMSGDKLHLRFSRSMTGAWQVKSSGVFDFPADNEASKSARLAAFLPPSGSAGACSWSLAGERGAGVELARDPPASCRVVRTDAELRVEGPADDATLNVRMSRLAPKLFVRQVVVVRRRGGRWDCQGRLVELRCEAGRSTPWEVLTPRALGAITWTAPGLHILEAGGRDGCRRWLIEPRATDADRFTLQWSAEPVADDPDAARVLETPAARFPAAAGQELWIMRSSADNLAVDAEGFTAERIPDWMQAVTAGLGGDENLSLWRTTDPNRKIVFTAPKDATPSVRPKVSGWVDMSVARSGRVRGRALWAVAEGEDRLTLSLPSGCEVLAVRVDGRAAAVVPAGNGALPVPIDARSHRSQIELEWSAPGAELPAPRDADVGPTLVRLRSPFGFESNAETISRAEWLTRLLDRECQDWLARASVSPDVPEDRIGLSLLHHLAQEASGASPSRNEQIWGAFLEKATTAKGPDAAALLANPSAAAGDFVGPRLDAMDADAVIDHYDFPGAPTLPPALDAARPETTRRRRVTPWLFSGGVVVLALLVLVGRRMSPINSD